MTELEKFSFTLGVDESINEVKRLCQDYCARNGSVFIADVLEALDCIAEQVKQSAEE